MALSSGQITDAFQQAVGRAPTGSELSQYSGDNSLEGSPGQQTLIGKLKGSGNYANAGAANSALNGVQNGVYNGSSGVQSSQAILSDLQASGQLPTTQAPQAPNLVQQYKDLQTQNGVANIQASISDLKAQQDTLASQLQVNKTAEQGKPVAQNVIEGRVSQETQQVQDQYDFIGRQLGRKVDELNAANNNIQTIMSLTGQDYSNAVQSYTTQFQQAISVINLVQGIQQSQKDENQKAVDNARANLQIFTNAITGGNLNYSDIPANQKANINNLEVQAGLPIGFTAAIKEKIDPKANIISTSENQGQIQVLVKNPDGSIGLQTYGTKNAPTQSASQSATQQKQYYTNSAITDARKGVVLKDMFAIYGGVLDPNTIYQLYNSNTRYGAAKENAATLAKYGVNLQNQSSGPKSPYDNG